MYSVTNKLEEHTSLQYWVILGLMYIPLEQTLLKKGNRLEEGASLPLQMRSLLCCQK